ncbi:hypothetical protein KY348_07255 [Candidatus Woesearchaeota archaeon]|nr:hypothetical protein [Candidatus Woesearchaeota archaeon]
MFTIVLIFLSLVFLAYSIFLCKKMINVFTRPVHRRAGHIIMSLMIIFFIGYILYVVFGYGYLFTNFLATMLFFLTAFFIMLVIQLNHSLIIGLTMKTLELKEFSEKLSNETQSLSSNKEQLVKIKSMLEAKNKEMEVTLKKLYSFAKPYLAKRDAHEQARQENAEQRTDKPSEKK